MALSSIYMLYVIILVPELPILRYIKHMFLRLLSVFLK